MNQPFTASDVRQAAVAVVARDMEYEAGMLDAYADLLEADEKAVPVAWLHRRLAEALEIIDGWMELYDHQGTGSSRDASRSEKEWAADRAKLVSLLDAHSAQVQPSDNRARSLIATWRARATREDEDGEPYESGGSSTRLLLCADELEAALAAHSAQAQPPVASVPGELAEPSKGTLNYEQELSFAEGWNACRAAMLAAQESLNG